ncbi:MAG TPA: DUF3626 domain-containing protein [Coleofasciculaceae cyanobacterium]
MTLTQKDAIALLSVLEEIDGEKIDGIESAELDSEQNIVGIYWKRDGKKKYRYAYKLGDDSAKTTSIDTDGISSFLEPEPGFTNFKGDAIALNERELELNWATEFAEVGVDFAETPTLPDPSTLSPEKLKQIQTAVVKRILQEGDRGYKGRIDEIVFEDGNPMRGLFSDRRTRPVKVLRYEITTTSKSFSPVSGFNDDEGDRTASFVEQIEWLEESKTLDFKGATAKTGKERKLPTCSKGWGPCGYACLPHTKKNCGSALEGQAKTLAEWLERSAKKVEAASEVATPKPTTKKRSPKKEPTEPELSSPIKTNGKELEKARKGLITRYGADLVEKAEKNTQKVLDEADLFIRVRTADTLEKILGSSFKTSAELGITDHDIPHLKDDYQTARNRVEAKVLGYGKDTKPGDRPIYGYLGGKDLSGASHSDVGAYGTITVKLKPEAKARSTFTGADSFKSGIASEVVNDGPPPPPNAASLVALTRHGYDKTALPSGYPSYYASRDSEQRQLASAARAKNIDDLAPNLSPSGNAYVEAQIHGGVKPSDIAELHFSPTKASDRPSPAIAKWAKENGVKLLVDGKEADLDEIINPPKRVKPGTPRPVIKAEDYTVKPELEKQRKGLERKFGKELVDKAEANLKKVMEDANIYIRVPDSKILELIVKDRFKTQFETGTSRGSFNPEYRKEVEKAGFAYPESTPDAMRPIYGYLENDPNGPGAASGYGRIAVKLKSEVKSRATFTGDDSFGRHLGSAVEDPKLASLLRDGKPRWSGTIKKGSVEAIAKAKTVNDALKETDGSGGSYMETQIHGQVLPSDIAEISFHSGEKPSAAIREWAKENGVKLIESLTPKKSRVSTLGTLFAGLGAPPADSIFAGLFDDLDIPIKD